MIDSFLAFIAPYDCFVCSAEGKLLCANCVTSVPNATSQCFNCSLLTSDFRTCLQCAVSSSLDSVWVCAEYEGAVKDLLHQYKFDQKRGAAGSLVLLLDQLMPPISPGTVVVSVPTASSRIRRRGFDHAALYAKQFAYTRGLTYLPCIKRTSQTRQLGLSKSERSKNVKGTMLVNSSTIKGKKVLLLDDVMTTGASLSEAARVLKLAGAVKVNAAVIARVSI